MSQRVVEMAGKRVALSNLEKDLYPAYGFSKARILEYYRGIAVFMLPHLRDRAVTLKRYPEGTDKDYFFEKRCPAHRPEWVRTAVIPQDDGERMTFCVVNDLETLMWVENLASLELHVPLARAGSPQTPDSMVFDLDPGEPAGLRESATVALILRDLLSRMGLKSLVKTSGQKGIHVFVPLNTGGTTFEDTKTFSRAVAGIMEKHYPELVTGKMAKQQRTGRVFINWSQNDDAKTMVSVYSLRAREAPFVSFPLDWKALENASRSGSAAGLAVLYDEALRRTGEEGDRFQEMLVTKQKLPHL